MATLVLASSLASAAVGLAYVDVLFNRWGHYPLRDASTSYVRSPYWLGLPASTVLPLIVLQVGALVGYVVWLFWVSLAPPTRGLLARPGWRHGLVLGFLAASAAWPYATHPLVDALTKKERPALSTTLASCASLWTAAACVIGLVGGTFEAQYASPWPTLGILLLALVVVLVDGVGWSAVALFRTLYDQA